MGRHFWNPGAGRRPSDADEGAGDAQYKHLRHPWLPPEKEKKYLKHTEKSRKHISHTV